MIEICEIFASIQGESTLQGMPCVFVRLTGCNLDCTYCDTVHARSGGVQMSVEDIIGHVKSYGISFVCITGGEPLCQEGTPELVSALVAEGFRVSVETNGSLAADVLPVDCIRIIDIKCPGSGAAESFHQPNAIIRRPSDEFKFVVGSREDFDFARLFIRHNGLSDDATILLSPVSGQLDPAVLSEWIISELPLARLNLQLHRYIWPDESRGR